MVAKRQLFMTAMPSSIIFSVRRTADRRKLAVKGIRSGHLLTGVKRTAEGNIKVWGENRTLLQYR